MRSNQITDLAVVSAEALFRLELLLGERVVNLGEISEIVIHDGGLKSHILQLAHDSQPTDETSTTVHECIVKIGIERLRESLQQTHFRFEKQLSRRELRRKD